MCEHNRLEKKYHIYENGYLVEYSVYCVDCGAKVGNWEYGNYYEEEEYIGI